MKKIIIVEYDKSLNNGICMASSAMPIILLTANDMETNILAGLESGADDYVTKPFSLAVLRARVNARLRDRNAQAKEIYKTDNFSFFRNKPMMKVCFPKQNWRITFPLRKFPHKTYLWKKQKSRN